MSISSRKRSWFSWIGSEEKRFWFQDGKAIGRRRLGSRLRVEILEDRTVPAVDLSQFKTFLPDAVAAIQTHGVNDELYNLSLPLVANALKTLTGQDDSPANFLTPVQQKLQTALNSLNATPAESDFLTALNTELGGLVFSNLQRVAGFDDPADPGTNQVEYTFQVGLNESNALSTTVPLAENLGLPGLRIDLNGQVNAALKVWYDATVRFGVEVTAGDVYNFYIRTDTNNPELNLHVQVDASGANLSGTIGLLQLTEAIAQPGAVVQMDCTADLTSPDGKLDGSELTKDGVEFISIATLNTDVTLATTEEFGGSAFNPVLKSDLNLDWTAAGNPEVATLTEFNASPPMASFTHVRLDLNRGLFKGFAAPILENIREITAPIEPIVTALNSKPLEKLGENETWLEILSSQPDIPDTALRYFDVVTALVKLADAAEIGAGNSGVAYLNLGSFNLTDVRTPDSIFFDPPTSDAPLGQLGTLAQGFYDALVDVNDGSPAVPDGQAGFDLNFLEHPEELFKLFLGDPNANLFTFTMPTLEIGKAVEKTLFTMPIPPFGPLVTLDLGVTGSIGFAGNLKVGYDATGLSAYRNDPDHDPALLFKGFYIDTTRPLLTIAGWDPDYNNGEGRVDTGAPILGFQGSVQVGLDLRDFAKKAKLPLPNWLNKFLSVITISAAFNVDYGLVGSLSINLNGDNDKFRYTDLGNNCLLTVAGQIGLGGEVSVEANVSVFIPIPVEIPDWFSKLTKTNFDEIEFSKSWDFDLFRFPTIPLFAFESECPGGQEGGGAPPEFNDPQLATLLPDGTLRLNVGANVGGAPAEGKRQIEPTEINEHYLVSHDSGDATGETIIVEAFGVSQKFSGVKRILAEAGDGDDEIILDSGVLVPSTLVGGDGYDILKAGGGAALLDGGAGDDVLTGGGQADEIFGGDGNDTIDAGAGDDIIHGGQGDDVIDGGDGYDRLIEVRDTNWSLVDNELNGNGTDTLTRVDLVQLTGGPGVNSFTVREWGGDVALDGLDGDDTYTIEVGGSENGVYTIADSSGTSDTLTVQGSDLANPDARNRDDFILNVGQVTEDSEQINYTGIDHLTVDGGTGQDRINVRATAPETPVLILGGDGSDLIRVSSHAGDNDDGDLAAILGPLTIDAGGGGPTGSSSATSEAAAAGRL